MRAYRPLLIALLLALALGGCAAAQNTRAQDIVWAAYQVCHAQVPNNIQIDRVQPDGGYWWRTTQGSYGVQQLDECMRAEVARLLR
jgi:hypothetical protein